MLWRLTLWLSDPNASGGVFSYHVICWIFGPVLHTLHEAAMNKLSFIHTKSESSWPNRGQNPLARLGTKSFGPTGDKISWPYWGHKSFGPTGDKVAWPTGDKIPWSTNTNKLNPCQRQADFMPFRDWPADTHMPIRAMIPHSAQHLIA